MSDKGIGAIALDSWAILSLLEGEPPGKVVRDILNPCEGDKDAKVRLRGKFGLNFGAFKPYLNLINLGEVLYIIGRRRGEKEAFEVFRWLKRGPVEIVQVSEEFMLMAVRFKIRYTVSYADAFALATAHLKKAYLLTGDPEIQKVDEVPLLWIGR